ncbi:hypothetical protein MNV49_003421 [Pseudohyphozyma bogoriensis]|nr:hypothetical protein MNV49_003421 [Pseudohyphozyma bogoriensis]
MSVQDWSRIIGTVGAGTMSGLMLSIPLWSFPVMWGVPSLSEKERVHIWSKTYAIGKATALKLIPVSTLSFLISAYYSSSSTPLTTLSPIHAFVSHNRRSILLLAAGFMALNIPYTGLRMNPHIHKLQRIEREMMQSPDGKSEHDTDALITHWLGLHNVRFALTFTAFALALTELVFA